MTQPEKPNEREAANARGPNPPPPKPPAAAGHSAPPPDSGAASGGPVNLSEAADLGDRDMPQQADLDANPVEQEIAQLQAELAETQARLLRVSADYQNYIRRTQQNLAEAREQQRRDMAKAAIPVMDHFDLALTVDADKTSAADLLKGVQMVRDELLKALEQFGLRRLDVRAGEPFNPEHHQAVLRQQTPGVAGNHVAAMLQPGYTLDDRPLRPAKVIVAE